MRSTTYVVQEKVDGEWKTVSEEFGSRSEAYEEMKWIKLVADNPDELRVAKIEFEISENDTKEEDQQAE